MNDFILFPDMITEFDAVVVGGGPVGLWVACELALAQLKVAVLERRTERVTQSRALTIHGRTLEVFALRGIVDRFLSLGRPVPNFHFGALGTRIDFSTLDTRYPFALFLPQATTEGLLEDYALELGVDIRRGHFVETVESHEDRVVIGGRPMRHRFAFVRDTSSGPMALVVSCDAQHRSILSAIRLDKR
jgi:2-polyprenyl-6-methoxyphenol hydroxylase-like FAD-dependent oxidoreductase